MGAQVENKVSSPSIDNAHKAKTLICALNFLSRNLPLPPDVLHTVFSIYNGETDALAAGSGDPDPLRDDSDAPGVSGAGDLLLDLEDALVRQRSKCMSGSELKQSKELRSQSFTGHRLKELEELPPTTGEDLQTKCLLELYGLKLVELQNKVRSDVSSEYLIRASCISPNQQLYDWGMMRLCRQPYGIGDAFAVDNDEHLRKKRDAERLSRFEEEERNRVESRKRRFFAEILNSVREFQLQIQAALKRRKQRNDGIQVVLICNTSTLWGTEIYQIQIYYISYTRR